MQKKQLIARKPAYHHGQLLLENDFVDEQQFHSDARYRHARCLHGFGVVHGLEVTLAGELAISVSPGFAVDRRGHEIELREAETLELHGLPTGTLAWVTIGYRTERAERGSDADNRIGCYAYLQVATGVERDDVRLARVQLDSRGRLEHNAINHHERDHLRADLAPGSVTPEALDAQLRTDWLTMAFHPAGIPRDESDTQPPFRVGATRAVAHKELDGKPNVRGAAGTMAIVLPPGIRHIYRLRIAGTECEKGMTARLCRAASIRRRCSIGGKKSLPSRSVPVRSTRPPKCSRHIEACETVTARYRWISAQQATSAFPWSPLKCLISAHRSEGSWSRSPNPCIICSPNWSVSIC